MKAFIGDRLRIAREISGLSLSNLSIAMHSCVSKQSLSKYEQGIMKPHAKNMEVLSKTLGVTPDFFYGESMKIDIPMLRTSSQRTLTEEEIIEMESIIVFHAERFMQKAKSLNVDIGFDCSLQGRYINNLNDASTMADLLRQEWSCGDGAISSVLRLLERHGIWIFTYNLPENILGLSTWVDDKYPLIILDTREHKTTVERLRFTAAHELGHLIFRFPYDVDVEKMCNKFASLFLFPQKTFIQELCWKNRDELYLEELIDLHEAYGVSVAALVHEAYDLGVISREHYDYWFDSIIKNNPKEEGWGKYLFPETLGKENRMNAIISGQNR